VSTLTKRTNVTMTGGRQIVSFTISSLFAHCGYCRMQMTKTAYERELDRLPNACEGKPLAMRPQGVRAEMASRRGDQIVSWVHCTQRRPDWALVPQDLRECCVAARRQVSANRYCRERVQQCAGPDAWKQTKLGQGACIDRSRIASFGFETTVLPRC
jgi:hypothetical protein